MSDTPIKNIYSVVDGQRILVHPATSITAVSGLSTTLDNLNTSITNLSSQLSSKASASDVSSINSQLEEISSALSNFNTIASQINNINLTLFEVGSTLTDFEPEYLKENIIRVSDFRDYTNSGNYVISPAFCPIMENYFAYNSFTANVMLRFELLTNMTNDFKYTVENEVIQAMVGNGFYVLPIKIADEIETLNGNAFMGHLPVYAESDSASSSAMYVNGQQIASAFFWGDIIMVSAPLTAGKYWIQGTLMSAPDDIMLTLSDYIFRDNNAGNGEEE